jgi:uncharacterized membrane protein
MQGELMTTRQIAGVLFGVAMVLAVVAAFVPPAHARLLALAVAFVAAGLAVQVLA